MISNSTKPLASLSLDLDNKWSYMKTHGDRGWESFPSYLSLVVPRVLSFLKERNLAITFFVVGQDAALEKNREALGGITGAGHEIGSHSFNHEPWLHLYSEQQIEAELAKAEDYIEEATGQTPIGFRGPGFSLSRAALRVLVRRNYLYDATTFPSYLGPLARAYYFMTARLSSGELQQRKALFGKLSEGLRPVKPYRWRIDGGTILEIPVTTVPVLKIPMHVSYILYAAGFSRSLALSYFKTALGICKAAGVQPSLLLHPLDFLGCDDERDLSFFPAMNLPGETKIEVVSSVIKLFTDSFNVVPVGAHAAEAARLADLPLREPTFELGPGRSAEVLQ